MDTTKMIATIKLTDETVAVAMGVSAVAAHLRGGVVLASGVLGLGGTGLSNTGLSRDWTTPVDVERVERSDRPTKAPKAVAATATYGYAYAIGAGTQQDQQIQAAAFTADATRSMRAFRGLEPWRERT
ncbi:hypothetical protein ACIQGZ_06095 [Streptomyces sp. NPDC092296]|uniref:hypothetical protein n=1 Tax=Streptomyces sp. NPDC092296 TaxID=3366012 RepID=UPI00380CB75C